MGSESLIATVAALIVFTVVFVHMFIACRSLREVIAAIILLAAFLVCYGDYIVVFAARGFGADAASMRTFLGTVRSGALKCLPHFAGVPVAGRTLGQFHPSDRFSCGPLAAYLLLACYLVRAVLVRYVTNAKLRRVGREYWLYIALYLVLVAVIGEISNRSFGELLILTSLIIAIFVGLVLRLGLDAMNAIGGGLRLLWRAVRIAFMYIALVGARIAKGLRNSLRWFRRIYERYLVQPIVSLGAAIRRALERFEARAKERLDKEKLDD